MYLLLIAAFQSSCDSIHIRRIFHLIDQQLMFFFVFIHDDLHRFLVSDQFISRKERASPKDMYVQSFLFVLLLEILIQVMDLTDLFVHDLDIIIESFLLFLV